jgi:hypothetical protein
MCHNSKANIMDNTKRSDVGYTYWTLSSSYSDIISLKEIERHVMEQGYSLGDGYTFLIVDINISKKMSYLPSYVLIEYGNPIDIAHDHTVINYGKNYTMIDMNIEILDITKYSIDKRGEIILNGVNLDISTTDAAYIRGIQYNRGDVISTFRKLTSYILSRYDLNSVSIIRCSSSNKYSVRSTTSPSNMQIIKGIIINDIV